MHIFGIVFNVDFAVCITDTLTEVYIPTIAHFLLDSDKKATQS